MFEQDLKRNLYRIWNRMSSGSYFPPAVKRVEIAKKNGGTRVLGVPTVSDRVAQMVAKLYVEPRLDSLFHADSYGYRPGRSAKQAIAITRQRCWRYDWVVEFDIKGAFTRINSQWLRKMVAHRIADPVILSLIGKWLNAEAMKDGVVIHTEEGTPQGAPISPELSNIYLHFLLDLWFEKKIKPACWGEAYLVRFADDFVATFQYREDVDRFQTKVRERFPEFGLELAEEKTRCILFGRFAAITRQRYGQGRPATFEFLGFKHLSGTDRSGRFALFRIPSAKSCRKFLIRTQEWIFEHRHWRRWEQQQHLTRMLRGF